MTQSTTGAVLRLEDGTCFPGVSFGHPGGTSGEVVFNTGMVGYPETLTDPSYAGQMLTLTYPLVGNYGVPADRQSEGFSEVFESSRIQVRALLVSEICEDFSHWDAERSLAQWLRDERVPALSGIDTRELTKHLRERGSMLGRIIPAGDPDPGEPVDDPNRTNLVAGVSVTEPRIYERGPRRIVLVDCGAKNRILRNLLDRNVTVIRAPWNYDFTRERFDGVLVSNGPGDPTRVPETIDMLRRVMERRTPVFGICLGSQLLALAAGASTYKLKFGHRSQNQPCLEAGTNRCYITSQNHGYAVDPRTLPEDWEVWFTNANDGTNEGFRHRSLPFRAVQFHPEATPGPVDTNPLFDDFLRMTA